MVMATPALRALRNKFGPEAQIIGVMRPYVADVLNGTHWFDDVLLYQKRTSQPDLNGHALVRKLRAAKLDELLLLTNSLRTAWMAWRSGVKIRTGYVGDLRRWLLTNRLAPPRNHATGKRLPTLDAYLHLVTALGCRPESSQMELTTTNREELAADGVWQQLGLPAGERVVVINSGGAFGIAKNWPVEHFAALAQRIVSDWGGHVLVNSGPWEREFAREIVARAADRRVVTLADIEELPVGLTKAAIRRARLLITTDSGPRFFGIAFGKPVVTLFGPTDPVATDTHYEGETCLSLSLDCQPCMERKCPLKHHRCMRDLSVDWVYSAVVRHLAADNAQDAA